MVNRTRVGFAALGVVGVLLAGWASYGPYLFETCCHPTVTPYSQAWRLAGYLLWAAVMLVAYWRNPAGPMWKLVLFYLVANGTWVLGYIGPSLAWTLAQYFQALGDAVFVHILLAFPSGRLSNPFDRVFVGAVYVTGLMTQAAFHFFWNPDFTPECGAHCPTNVFVVIPNNEVAEVIGRVSSAVCRSWWRSCCGGSGTVGGPPRPRDVGRCCRSWWRCRLRRSSHRCGISPSRSVGTRSASSSSTRSSRFRTSSSLPVPLGILRSRLARGSVADLAVELGRGVSLGNLRAVMARALRDPSLELAFQAPSGSGFVDADGRPIELPAEDSADRAVTRVEREGETVAVLIHDPGLEAESPGLVGAAGSVAALALENERLSAQVRAQLDEVRASRARIVEAGDAERQRIERDLHDGAQQRLVALALRLQTARATTTDASELIDQATAELQAAVAEVRDIGRGLHPPILTERGLAAALEALAERASTPVEINASDDRYPPSVEAAAYFVAAEALTNVDRYSAASSATVTVTTDGRRLLIEITDDGVGGADPLNGSGLKGLSDRVAAMGGELTVSSPSGQETTVRASIPLS